MRLIVDGRNGRLREIVREDAKEINFSDIFVDLGYRKIRDLNKENSFMITVDADIPPGMTEDDVQCFKKYNWCYDFDNNKFVRVI